MNDRRSDLVDTGLEEDAIIVSSLERDPGRGWVYLAVLDGSRVIRVSLTAENARLLAEHLQKHAGRVQ